MAMPSVNTYPVSRLVRGFAVEISEGGDWIVEAKV